MINRTGDSLAIAQAVPLDLRVGLTKKKIQEFLDSYPAYISFSGGKDSMVLMHLVKQVDSSVPVVFCDTGMEFPDVRANAVKYADIVLKPKHPFTEVIRNHGYPVVSKETSQKIKEVRTTKSDKLKDKRMGKGSGSIPLKHRYLIEAPFKVSDRCCYELKKNPFKRYEKETGRKPFIGTLASESRLRFQSWVKYGCNMLESNRPASRPLMLWTEELIFEYLKENGLELPTIYSRLTRTGCMFCLFGADRQGEDRFTLLKELYPSQYKFFMDKLGFREVIKFMEENKCRSNLKTKNSTFTNSSPF